MSDHSILPDLVLTYAIALVLVVTLARARVPSIVALMLAGVVAGPSGIRIISTPEEVDMLAEIGIVLLLFTVGLDFSLAALKQFWRVIVAAGTLQIGGTAAAVAAALSLVAGIPTPLAIFIGLFVALSSTAIVLKGLTERNELSRSCCCSCSSPCCPAECRFQPCRSRSDARSWQSRPSPASAAWCCRRCCGS
jgi:CPA2 family monovalent cation:H+ antiporter-2